MKNKVKSHKISIREKSTIQPTVDETRIGKIRNKIHNTSSHAELVSASLEGQAERQGKMTISWHTIAKSFAALAVILCFSYPVNAQHLRLVIGEYACTSNSQCGDDEYCDIDSHECKGKPVCETCEVCKECAECTECETCPTPVVCNDGEYNVDGRCVKCVGDSGCTTGQHCSTSGQCVGCLTDDNCPEKCNTTTNECQTCFNIDSTKPYWNALSKVCEACPLDNPVWNGTGCDSCPAGYEWDETKASCQKKTSCTTNSDCEAGKYCQIVSQRRSGSCNESNSNYYINLSGTCTSLGHSEKTNVTGIGMVYRSDTTMTWWAAKNWCQAQGMSLLDANKLGCYMSNTTKAITFNPGVNSYYCCEINSNCGDSKNLLSQPMKDIRAKWNSSYGWVVNGYYAGENSCIARLIYFDSGNVGINMRYARYYALCQ